MTNSQPGQLPEAFDPDTDGTALINSARDWALAELADVDDSANVSERITELQRILDDFVHGVAHGVETGGSSSVASQSYNAFVSAAEDAVGRSMAPSKTQLKDYVEEIEEDVRAARAEIEGVEQIPTVDDWIEQNHVQTTTVRSTDAKQHTTYVWEFDDPEKGQFAFETGTKDGERGHFHWSQFRDEIFDAGAVDLAKPHPERRGGEEWRRFIVPWIEEGPTKTTKGPRSDAVDKLRNHIKRQSAYHKLADANDRTSPHYNAEHEELWIPNGEIKRITEDAGLTSVRALQVELDARGHTSDRISGVSETRSINGALTTWWVLDAEIEDPVQLIEDADEHEGKSDQADRDADQLDQDQDTDQDQEDSQKSDSSQSHTQPQTQSQATDDGVATFDGDIEINGDSLDN